MSQPSKSNGAKAACAFFGLCKALGLVVTVTSACIIAVPVGAGPLVAWIAGAIFDALRPKRTGEHSV